MTKHFNQLGLEVGFPVNNWQVAKCPTSETLNGAFCHCEPLDKNKHIADLFQAYQQDTENGIWVYLPYGPFASIEEYAQWMNEQCFNGDPYFYAIIDNASNKAIGVASYLRIDPEAGSIEVGHINYSPLLQNTIMATEAMYLMMKNAFDLGYRRYEWKCNALNKKSCNAAQRLGFTYEGTFRQMMVVKGRNRDSAWFSILDKEWPTLKQAFITWLSEDNFDSDKQQKQSLSSLTQHI